MTKHDTTVHDSVTAVDSNQWNNLVEQSSLGTVFHRHEWLRAIEAGLDRPAHHAVVTKGSNPVAILPTVMTDLALPDAADTPAESIPGGEAAFEAVSGLVPSKRLVSLHPGYGGPVIASDPIDCLDALLDAVETAADGTAIAHKLRTGTLAQTRYGKYLTGRGYEPTVVSCRFVLDLTVGWDRIEANMHRTRRNGLPGDDTDLVVRREAFAGDTVARTHRAYVRNLMRTDGTPYPYGFFEALSEHMGHRIEVFTAVRDGTVLGRYVCLVDAEQSTLRYQFSAIPDDSAYEHDVSEALHAAAIRWAIDAGYDAYDFGATGADFTDGLFQYKEQYGADVRPILQWDRGLSPVAWTAVKLGRRLYRERTY